MRYTKKPVYETSVKIANLVKKAITVTEPYIKTITLPGEGDVDFNAYDVVIKNVDGISEIKAKLIERKEDYDLDNIITLLLSSEVGLYNPSDRTISIISWCSTDKLLGMSFYSTIAHEVNHYYQHKNRTYGLGFKELEKYRYCVDAITKGSEKNTMGASYRYYASRKNEIDSNIQGFAHVIDIFSVNPDGKEIVDEWYAYYKNTISTVMSSITKTDDPSVIKNFKLYSRGIDRVYKKACLEIA